MAAARNSQYGLTFVAAITLPRTALLVIVALIALFPLFGSTFYVQLGAKIMIMAIFALSLDLLVGHTGLVSFGHAAYFGVAAYALALFAPLPALFAVVPALQDLRILGVPLIWWLLGLLAYPLLYLFARLHRRQAERIEREFTELLGHGPYDID